MHMLGIRSAGSYRRRLGAAAAVAAVVTASACGSGDTGADTTGSGGADTVAVDVGTDRPVQLSTGPLTIGVFMNDTTNAWQESVVRGATTIAKKYGWNIETVSGGYDVQKQMNQIQTAVASGKYDAIVAIPIDGTLECKAFSETLAAANVLVSIGAQQLCGKNLAGGEELWQEGTLNFVGGTGTTAPYVRAWLEEAAKRNPGEQDVAYVVGPQVLTAQQVIETIVKDEFQPEHPDFAINDFIYTDYTTPDSYQKTLDYLNANPDTDIILSNYSPDMTRGVIQAIEAAGRTGEVTVVDSGGAEFSIEQIAAGNIQFTSPLFPEKMAEFMVESIKAAQDGAEPERYISDIPEELSTSAIYIVDENNHEGFEPQY
jgi:ribose transport system substrate-binding protein